MFIDSVNSGDEVGLDSGSVDISIKKSPKDTEQILCPHLIERNFQSATRARISYISLVPGQEVKFSDTTANGSSVEQARPVGNDCSLVDSRSGKEVGYGFYLTFGQKVTATMKVTEGASSKEVLYLSRCSSADSRSVVACHILRAGDGSNEFTLGPFSVQQSDLYYLFVDSYAAGESYKYDLSIKVEGG